MISTDKKRKEVRFIAFSKELIKNYIKKNFLDKLNYELDIIDICDLSTIDKIKVIYATRTKKGEPLLKSISIDYVNLEEFRVKQQTGGIAPLLRTKAIHKHLKQNNYEKIVGFDYEPYTIPSVFEPGREYGEISISATEWEQYCKKAFEPSKKQRTVLIPSNLTPFQDFYENHIDKQKTWSMNKLMDILAYGNHWEIIKNKKEENNMKKIYDVLIVDKEKDVVCTREESIVAENETEALSKAGYYSLLEANDHNTKRYEPIINEIYIYKSIKKEE